ncbi:MAG: hypothetical protein L0G94_04095 [Brachybacterium sp.]|uniref:hypothetical protein n=1 Tax=Brachybacterium sp. TaxID=1891286 RepID=UPI00264826E8|nr:hypothetical protein [Brachybacterium sp.]MDN5685851.1 hypothetical protein [Brachybacterium sp.]
MRVYRFVPIAAAVALAAGCTGPEDQPEESPTTTSSPAAEETAASDGGGGEPTEWDVAPSGEAPQVRGDEGPAPAEDGDAEAAAKQATNTVEAYFNAEDPDKWWPAFSKHLTPAAQEVWQYTDPRRVPPGEVQGEATAGPVSATDAEITVPSTIGEFQLVLVRESTDDSWLVSAITPPEGAQ